MDSFQLCDYEVFLVSYCGLLCKVNVHDTHSAQMVSANNTVYYGAHQRQWYTNTEMAVHKNQQDSTQTQA